ncbi:hypothetical protein SAMN00777080_0515 [Aquiflexum balticum DSM 16537]|uniref:Uncharacterized protein n=1 Tax=Aquiflexum balticum DSM 16537 TaxID=758820 RepID=A0A1W2GZB9_9BACT|nr:contractile injection system tape measure protein [Aquiflexum balticum]SMD41979.1 hypothetical protein SAMN00777080_0515 [Aquiflexum balticum DSM 16537]
MISQKTHIIQNVTFQVDFEKMEEGLGLQEDLSLIFHQKIEPTLQKIFDSYSTEEFTIKIDKMVVDCGAVDDSDWEKMLLNRIGEQVEEMLRSEKNIGKKQVSKVKTANEVFFYFLQKGYFPWNSPFSDTDSLEKNVFITDSFIAEIAYLTLRSQKIVTRISNSFSKEFFKKLLKEITKDSERWVKDLTTGFLKQNDLNPDMQVEFLTIFLSKRKDKENSDSMNIWMELLKSKHLVNHTKFIKYLISKISEQNEMQASLLSAIKSRSFGTQEKIKAKIILEKILHSKPDFEHVQWFRDCMALVDDSDQFSDDFHERLSKKIKLILPKDSNHPENKSFEMKDQKNNKEEQFEDSIYIQNAGMVLLHPFLTALFENLNLVKDKAFISINHRNQAIGLLEFLVWGDNKHSENSFPLNKILCGISPGDLWVGEFEMPQNLKNEGEELLTEVIRHWEVLKNTGIDGLRETFLQRPGKLSHNQNGWKLIVEQKTVDILIGSLPWGLGIIKMPWMAEMLFVEWN